jgi:hypothetical protein
MAKNDARWPKVLSGTLKENQIAEQQQIVVETQVEHGESEMDRNRSFCFPFFTFAENIRKL